MQNHDHGHGHGEHHEGSYSTYILVWLALMILTVLTVGIAKVDLGKMNVIVALLVASVKTLLVLMFFMHLKQEPISFSIKLGIVIVIFAIMVLGTLMDAAPGVREFATVPIAK